MNFLHNRGVVDDLYQLVVNVVQCAWSDEAFAVEARKLLQLEALLRTESVSESLCFCGVIHVGELHVVVRVLLALEGLVRRVVVHYDPGLGRVDVGLVRLAFDEREVAVNRGDVLRRKKHKVDVKVVATSKISSKHSRWLPKLAPKED